MTASPQPQNHLERQQIHRSAARLTWRGLKEWVSTDAGRERWALGSAAVVGLVAVVFCSIIFYSAGRASKIGDLEIQLAETRAALHAEAKVNRNRTVENGCGLMAILAKLDPGTYVLPDWCVPILAHMPDRKPQP